MGPAFVRRERFPKGRDLYVGVASGVALGAHFGFWISSLDHTSVVLVSTQPVFVANLAYLLFGERTSPRSLDSRQSSAAPSCSSVSSYYCAADGFPQSQSREKRHPKRPRKTRLETPERKEAEVLRARP